MNIDSSESLIICTYNNPDYLNLSLLSLMNQSVLPAEVIIADDGSTHATKQLVDSFRDKLPIPIVHVWQEDNGFQAGKIRNIAIAAAQKQYIIQIDGDIIMEKHFIEDHLYHRRPNAILQGSRVLLGESMTEKLRKVPCVNLPLWKVGFNHPENAIRIQWLSNWLTTRYRNRYPVYYARGCNMSYWRDDFVRVNGYNHEFVGWGHEDSELTLRMLNAGCKKLYIKFNCVAYHLYHKVASRHNEKKNKELMDEQVALENISCEQGVNQFLQSYQDYILE